MYVVSVSERVKVIWVLSLAGFDAGVLALLLLRIAIFPMIWNELGSCVNEMPHYMNSGYIPLCVIFIDPQLMRHVLGWLRQEETTFSMSYTLAVVILSSAMALYRYIRVFTSPQSAFTRVSPCDWVTELSHWPSSFASSAFACLIASSTLACTSFPAATTP